MTVRADELFDLTAKVAVVSDRRCRRHRHGLRPCARRAGAAVALADLDGTAAGAAAEKLVSEGHRAIGVRLDITDSKSAAAMAETVTARFGGIDILINNAALMSEIPRSSLLDLPIEWFERILRVNVMGAVVCAKAVRDSMVSRGGGRIINGSSAGAFMPGRERRRTSASSASSTTRAARRACAL